MNGLKDDVRYKPKRFEEQLAELSPIGYKQYLRDTKGSGTVREYRADGSLWRSTKYFKGVIIKFSVYYPNGDLVTNFKLSNNDILNVMRGWNYNKKQSKGAI